MLLKCGASTNILDNNFGATPLHHAVGDGNIQAVRLLLEHGADVHARDKRGKTPSQLTKQQEIVELLFQNGAKSVK